MQSDSAVRIVISKCLLVIQIYFISAGFSNESALMPPTYTFFKKTKWEDTIYAWDLFPPGLCPHFPYFHILKLKRRKWKTLNAIKISLIENSAEIFETGEMKAVESIKFNGVFLLACIQSKWVHLVLWGKDCRENCLNTANFFERLLFFYE